MNEPTEDIPNKANSQIPTSVKKLRACINCKLVKTEEQFKKDGCENCSADKNIVSMNYLDQTSTNFEGVIAMMQPSESWVAKWNSIVRTIPGLYAISVSGQVGDNDKYD